MISLTLFSSQARSGLTQQIVSKGMKNKPGFNWIICGTKYHYKWNGVRGKDWNHEHKEFGISFGKTVGYALFLLSQSLNNMITQGMRFTGQRGANSGEKVTEDISM